MRQNKDVFDFFYFFNILKKTAIFPLKIALDLGLGRTDKGTSDCPLLANYAYYANYALANYAHYENSIFLSQNQKCEKAQTRLYFVAYCRRDCRESR